MQHIKCMRCKKRQATVKVVRIKQGTARSMFLCERCAAEVSPFQKQILSLQEAIEKVLAQLVQQHGDEGDEQAKQDMPDLVCESCGLTYGAYRESFLLGCAHCYEAFAGMLEPQLRRLHGSARHVGRTPHSDRRAKADVKAMVAALKKEMEMAISAEDFEKAAQLRDRIRHLKGEMNHVLPEMPEM